MKAFSDQTLEKLLAKEAASGSSERSPAPRLHGACHGEARRAAMAGVLGSRAASFKAKEGTDRLNSLRPAPVPKLRVSDQHLLPIVWMKSPSA